MMNLSGFFISVQYVMFRQAQHNEFQVTLSEGFFRGVSESLSEG